MVTVEQLMKKELVAVDVGTSVDEAAKLMHACNVSSMLITTQGRAIGIVTESDIVRKVVAAERAPYLVLVGTIMSSPIVGIEAHRQLTEAADLMNKHQTRHLGVTKRGAVVGILSVRDLLHPVSMDEF